MAQQEIKELSKDLDNCCEDLKPKLHEMEDFNNIPHNSRERIINECPNGMSQNSLQTTSSLRKNNKRKLNDAENNEPQTRNKQQQNKEQIPDMSISHIMKHYQKNDVTASQMRMKKAMKRMATARGPPAPDYEPPIPPEQDEDWVPDKEVRFA